MYERSRHYKSFHVAGFQYYDGAFVLDQLKVGTPLELVLEPDNPRDPNAIAIRFEGTKLGHVPASDNELMATLMHFGHTDVFEARVLQVDDDAEPWRQVRVGVYVRDARNGRDVHDGRGPVRRESASASDGGAEAASVPASEDGDESDVTSCPEATAPTHKGREPFTYYVLHRLGRVHRIAKLDSIGYIWTYDGKEWTEQSSDLWWRIRNDVSCDYELVPDEEAFVLLEEMSMRASN